MEDDGETAVSISVPIPCGEEFPAGGVKYGSHSKLHSFPTCQ